VIGDRLKVQKCTFLVTLDEFTKRLKGFDLTFFRYKWGPFSKQLWDVEGRLETAGLLVQRTSGENEVDELLFTEEGGALADDLCAAIDAIAGNRQFTEGYERVVGQFADADTKTLLDFVYDLSVKPIGGSKQRIKDMPNNLDITQVLDPEDADAEVVIPDGWLDTLAIMLSKGNRDGIQRAADDLAHGRVRSHEEVWA
jgi:hypothetical protein